MSATDNDPHIYHYAGMINDKPVEGFTSIGDLDGLKDHLKLKPGMCDISGLKVTKVTGSLTLLQREYLVAQMAVPGFVRLLEVIYEGAATTYYRSGVKAGTALLFGEISRWAQDFVRPDRVQQPVFRFEAELEVEAARQPGSVEGAQHHSGAVTAPSDSVTVPLPLSSTVVDRLPPRMP